MSKRNSEPKSLHQLFQSANSNLTRYQKKAELLKNYNELLHITVNEPLNRFCQVTNIEDGTLYCEVSSGTWLTKINYVRLDILSAFRQKHPNLVQVKFSINPSLSIPEKQMIEKLRVQPAKEEAPQPINQRIDQLLNIVKQTKGDN